MSSDAFAVPAAAQAVRQRLDRLAHAYAPLSRIDDPRWQCLLERAQPLSLPARSVLLHQQAQCDSFVLLLEGTVRIYQLAEDGREITLYRIAPGDTCVMTLASLIHGCPFKAFAEADSDIEALALSLADFREAMDISPVFRDWVMGSLTNSFCAMLDTFHDTVFDRLEMRLACLLGRLFERADDDTLRVTHQQLAQELGTSREVISRSLKRFERQGCIVLSRGQIRIAPGQSLPLDIQ